LKQGYLFKAWHMLEILWSIIMMFIASLFMKNPKDARKEDGTINKAVTFSQEIQEGEVPFSKSEKTLEVLIKQVAI